LRLNPVIAASIFIALTLGACSPLKIVNWTVPGDTYAVTENVAYGPEPAQKLDVYRPREAASAPGPSAGYPVVVFLHGGNRTSGERSSYRFVGEALAAEGILTVIAGFRLYPQVRYPDFLEDCALAVAWTAREAQRYGGDPGRLHLMGHSSGAYNAAMLALDTRWLSAAGLAPSGLAGWIGLAGPYDFFPMQDPKSQPVFHHPDYPAGALPVQHVSQTAPPAFLGAASSDRLVDAGQNSTRLAEQLSAAGVPVTLKVYDRVNHYTLIGAFARPLRWLEPVRRDVVAFVRREPA
jgi:acetyl esterase/lipase